MGETHAKPEPDSGAGPSLWRGREGRDAAPGPSGKDTGLGPQPPADPPADPPVFISLKQELAEAKRIQAEASVAAARVLDGFKQGQVVGLGELQAVLAAVLASVRRQPAALVNLARIKAAGAAAYAHAVSVSLLMVALARQRGMADEACMDCGLAGLLQDVGMGEMPPEWAEQRATLSPTEHQQLRGHAQGGHELLLRSGLAPGPWLAAASQHHERCDGCGYPLGLRAEQIDPVARMGAICDVYDALTSPRPHRPAWTPVQAMAAMAAARGQFDRAMLAGLIKLLGVYPVGTLVRLASQRLALVLEARPEAPRQPLLLPFFSLRTGSRLQAPLIDLQREPEAEKIVQVENPQTWGFTGLDALWLEQAA